MKITKFSHSCLLVEMPTRTALFDPGAMSVDQLSAHDFKFLDNIIITHEHPDHLNMEAIKKLIDQFPKVRIKAASSATKLLHEAGINSEQGAVDGVEIFDAPHENVAPLFESPDQIGVHYLGKLTHPGDSHNFQESKAILALPITGPWGATTTAVNLAIQLRPSYVIPIHDWHWKDEARHQMYEVIGQALEAEGIAFVRIEDGQPVNLDV